MKLALAGADSGVHPRADAFAGDGTSDIGLVIEPEEEHIEIVVAGQADRGGVGHFQALGEELIVGELIVAIGLRMGVGVAVIDRVDAVLAHQQDLRLDLQGTLSGDRVGGEVRHARAGAEDDDSALLHVALGAARNVGLGHLPHGDGRLDAGGHPFLLQEVLQGQRVHHRAEHAHVVGAVTVHTAALQLHTAEIVAAADHDRDLGTRGHEVSDLAGHRADDQRVDAELATPESLP
ncbi:hypothetical protein SDC9_145386 [bioreactor metagenome]|uniref:Uncharacterized protein n=1 Tax=bioreactor metagenome TaxID=1076179 RepID=A0A645EC16_9ZZZZ